MKFGWVLATAALVLVGCTPTAPPTTPAPTPTFMCTPEAGGAESLCSQQDFDKMKAKDAQYAEAEEVYREFLREYTEVMRHGGSRELTPGLKKTMGDEELSNQIREQLRDFKSSGIHVEGPGVEVKTIVRKPSLTRNGATVTVEFCIDASQMVMYQGKRREGTWGLARDRIFFRPGGNAGSLLMVGSDSVEVKTCD